MVIRRHIKVVTLIFGLSMVGACSDQKGFQARITKAEDLLRQKGIDPQSEEGQKFLEARKVAQGKPAEREVTIPPRRPVNRAQNGTEANDAASRGSPEDQAQLREFAEVVRSAVAAAPAARPPAPLNPRKGSEATAAELAEKARLAKVEKLKSIKESLHPSIHELLKGIDVRVTRVGDETVQAKEQSHKVNVDLYMAFEGKPYLSSAEGQLTPKNQLKSTDIVDLKVTREFSGTDLAEKKIKGLEYYAACDTDKDTCETVQIMILFNRADSTKISFIGRFRFDGTGFGTSLGDKLKTVAEAQAEFTKEESARQDAAKAREGKGDAKVAVESSSAADSAQRDGTGSENAGQRVWRAVHDQDKAKVAADLKRYLDKQNSSKATDSGAALPASNTGAKQGAEASAVSAPDKITESADAKFIRGVAKGWNDYWNGLGNDIVAFGKSIFYSGPITSKAKANAAAPAPVPAAPASSATPASGPGQ